MPRFSVALLQRVQQRGQDARAAGADRMSERDGAAVDVHPCRDRCRARRSTAIDWTENASLISNRSTSASFQPTFLASLADRLDRRHQHVLRRQPARRLADDARQRRDARVRTRASADITTSAAAPSLTRRRVAGGHGSVLRERRLAAPRAPRCVVSGADRFVAIEHDRVAFLLRNRRPAGSRRRIAPVGSSRGGLAMTLDRVTRPGARGRCRTRWRRPRPRCPCASARTSTTGRR